jgi:hypothetical protein
VAPSGPAHRHPGRVFNPGIACAVRNKSSHLF